MVRQAGRLAIGLVLAGLAAAPTALANGAFPQSEAVLLPADRPQQLVLTTNFGLIISDDGGASWQWTCERPETAMGALYAVGPAPEDRLYSLSPNVGLALSDDGSCSWRRAGGVLADRVAGDYFPDPTDATRVLAVAAPAGDGAAGISALYASSDGGATFGATPLFTAPDGAVLVAVESARSDPRVIYLSLQTGSHPALVRSSDGGATWTTLDVEPALGANSFRIIAVDPDDADVVYLRVLAPAGEALAITRDGGATVATPVTVPAGTLSAFARLASGTVLVAGLIPSVTDAGRAGDGVAWRSSDGGLSFEPWTLAPQPRLRALAERGGILYLAADNYADGWALAASSDEGRTISPLARYDQVSAIKACAVAACRDLCDDEAGLKIWAPEVCTAASADASADAGPPPGRGGGCGCSLASPEEGGGGWPAAALALAFALRRRLVGRDPKAARRACRSARAGGDLLASRAGATAQRSGAACPGRRRAPRHLTVEGRGRRGAESGEAADEPRTGSVV